MSKSLAASFASGTGRKTKWQGKTVYAVFQIPVTAGDTIELSRIDESAYRAQAIKLSADRDELSVNGIVTPTVAIWTHTAPIDVAIKVVGKKTKTVDLWNSWSFDGVDSSWLGSAGMLVDKTDDGYTVRCSDGLGDATFDDLTVTVNVRHANE